MKWNEFEDRLKKEVNTSASAIDTEALWKKINQKQKKKVFPFFWILLVTLIVGAITISGLLLTDSLKINNFSNKLKDGIYNQNYTIKNSPNTLIKASNLITEKSSANITENLKGSTPEIINDKKNTIVSQNANTVIIAKSKKINTTKKISNDDLSTLRTPSTKSQIQLISESNPRKLNTETKFVLINNSKLPETEIRANEEKESSNGPFLNSVNNEFTKAPIILPNLAINLLEFEKAKESFKFNYCLGDKTISKRDKRTNTSIISIYAGVGIWAAKITSPDTIFNPYLAQRRNTESEVEYLDAGLSYEKLLYHAFNTAIITGLKFQRFTSRFSYIKNWEVTDTIFKKATSFNFYSNGFSDTSYNESSVKLSYSRNMTHYNTLSSISIPVYFRILEYAIGSKLSLSPIIGLNIGFWQSAEGYILNSTGEFIKINDIDKIYNTGFSISWEAQVQANYKLNDNQFFYLQTFYLNDLSSRTISQYQLKQKNSSIGIRLGYGFKF